MVPAIDRLACQPLELDGPADNETEMLDQRWPEGCDLLVIDHYQRDEKFELACRPWANQIMAIDDLNDRKHNCDILLDQTLGAKVSHYEALVPNNCKILLGPNYALLRPQFLASRENALKQRGNVGDVKRILTSFGSGPADNLICLAINGLSRTQFNGHVDVVLGSGAKHPEITNLVADMPDFSVAFHVEVKDMARLMSEADLAIGAAGMTSWERCCLGLPALIVVLASNQKKIATELENAGAGVVLGWHESVSTEVFADKFTDVISRCGQLPSMSKKAAAICDGQGIRRVVQVIST